MKISMGKNFKWKNEYKILWVLYTHLKFIGVGFVLVLIATMSDTFINAVEEPERLAGIIVWAGVLMMLIHFWKQPDGEMPWGKKEREKK